MTMEYDFQQVGEDSEENQNQNYGGKPNYI